MGIKTSLKAGDCQGRPIKHLKWSSIEQQRSTMSMPMLKEQGKINKVLKDIPRDIGKQFDRVKFISY